MSRFRILSLDGGGIKGTFTAAFLAELEIMTGKRIIDYFDLITGTSTGGILALGLGLGISANELLKFYEKNGPVIFPLSGIHMQIIYSIRRYFRTKYSADTLRKSLESVFDNRRLSDSKRMLAIPSFNATSGNIHIFKTAHSSRFKQDYKYSAVDVALATSAAPTYFPAFIHNSGVSFIDGGVWANSPVMVGIVEAVSVLKNRIEDIELLSIGTTESPLYIQQKKRLGGICRWVGSATDILTNAQCKASIAQGKLMIGDRFLRIDEITSPGRFTLDNSNEINELKGLGINKARIHENEISMRFFNDYADPFKPNYN